MSASQRTIRGASTDDRHEQQPASIATVERLLRAEMDRYWETRGKPVAVDAAVGGAGSGPSEFYVVVHGSSLRPLTISRMTYATMNDGVGLVVDEWRHDIQERTRSASLAPGLGWVPGAYAPDGRCEDEDETATPATGKRPMVRPGDRTPLPDGWRWTNWPGFVACNGSGAAAGVRPNGSLWSEIDGAPLDEILSEARRLGLEVKPPKGYTFISDGSVLVSDGEHAWQSALGTLPSSWLRLPQHATAYAYARHLLALHAEAIPVPMVPASLPWRPAVGEQVRLRPMPNVAGIDHLVDHTATVSMVGSEHAIVRFAEQVAGVSSVGWSISALEPATRGETSTVEGGAQGPAPHLTWRKIGGGEITVASTPKPTSAALQPTPATVDNLRRFDALHGVTPWRPAEGDMVRLLDDGRGPDHRSDLVGRVGRVHWVDGAWVRLRLDHASTMDMALVDWPSRAVEPATPRQVERPQIANPTLTKGQRVRLLPLEGSRPGGPDRYVGLTGEFTRRPSKGYACVMIGRREIAWPEDRLEVETVAASLPSQGDVLADAMAEQWRRSGADAWADGNTVTVSLPGNVQTMSIMGDFKV